MATHHGNSGSVLIGANVVAEITGFSYDEAIDVADDSAMGDSAKTHLSGKTSASGTISCHWDSSDADGQALMTSGDTITLLLHPEGTGSGLAQFSVPCTITSRGVSVEQDGIVGVSFGFERNGAHDDTAQT